MTIKNSFKNLIWSVGLVVGISSVSAQPCYTNFRYRTPVLLTNSGAALSDYQVKLTMNTAALVTAGKMSNIGKDVRFLNKKGDELKFWIEDGTMNTSSTNIWLLADSIQGYGIDTIYMYYGNSAATPKSDASATFIAFDDFNGTSLSSSWSSCGSGSYTVTGGRLNLSTASSTIELNRSTAVNKPVVVEALITAINGAQAVVGAVNNSGTGYGLGLSSSAFQVVSLSNTGCYTTSSVKSTGTSTSNGLASFVWNGTGSQSASWDGSSLSSTSTTYTSSTSYRPTLGLSGGTGSVQIDQFRVRTYASSVPTATLGTEIDMNFTITADYAAPLCEDGVLQLQVNSIAGASYAWTGPNSFSSNVQNPKITGVSTSDAGRYDVTVSISSGCASKSSSVNVNISPKAQGGKVSGTQTVCSGSNYGVLSLSGHTGNVSRWDSSASTTGPWYPISNTQLNQTYSNLTQTTYYRAIVTNGNCSVDSSSFVKISVTSPSDGGKLSGSATVCSGSNSGTLTLSGFTGNVVRWESSENGNLWNSMVNNTTGYQYSNLTKTMHYRAVVKNGNCNVDYSSVAIVSVDLASVGGSTSGAKTVCPDDNKGEITVSGIRGAVINWEYSNTGTSNWQTIAITSDTLSYSNLAANRYYRAVVKNGSCPTATSTSTLISVFAKSSAGVLSGGTTVCEGSNSGTLTLSGSLGTVLKWQSKTNSTSWADQAVTSTGFSWYNLDDSTSYRAIVANSGCSPDTSNIESVHVHKESLGGYLSGTDKVCVSGNTVSLTAMGTRGSIVDWETSSTGYAPWTGLQLTSDKYTQQNLASTTHFRIVVKNGVCPKATSSSFEVEVNSISVGGTAGPDVKVCQGQNFGVITLTNNAGEIQGWESSNSLNGTWTAISNNTAKQEFQNLNDDKYFRAIVKNGSCKADTSSIAHVTVSENTIAGTLSGEAQHCSYTNSGTLRLSDLTGDIQYWENSVNGGDQWNKLPVNTDDYTYSDLSTTTLFRVAVKSGACETKWSNLVKVSIAKATASGALSTSDLEVCSSSNFGNVILKDEIGEIVGWQSSTENTSWVDLLNKSSQHTYYNITEKTSFRVIVKNQFCDSDTSDALSIDVHQPSFGGLISGKDRTCEGTELVPITLSGNRGSIVRWEESRTAQGPWFDLNTTNQTIVVDKPTQTTFFRTIVQNGVCPPSESDFFMLTVDQLTSGGDITGGREVCSGSNSGELVLRNTVGEVVRWEQKVEGNFIWDSVSNLNNTLTYEDISQSTTYRAVLKNGVCDEMISAEADLIVNPVPVIDIEHGDLCDGEIIDFKQKVTIATGNITGYQWIFSDGFTSTRDQFSKSFLLPGTYDLTLTAHTDKGCSSTLNSELIVSETPYTYFTINGGLTSNTGCLNTDLTMINLTEHLDAGSLDYSWNFGDGTTSQSSNPVVTYDKPGDYTITLSAVSRTGCSSEFESTITIFPANPTIAGNDVTVSKGIGHQLEAFGAVRYNWTPAEYLNDASIANPMARIQETTTFTVHGTDYFGCVTSDDITLTVNDDYTVIPNNVITPDGNGDNDVWVIENLETYPSNTVHVFDRWGRVVFETTSYQNDWGATDQSGKLLMDGTYYYVLEFPDVEKVMKGAITVIKNR